MPAPRTRFQQITLAALVLLAGFLCYTIVQPFLYSIVAAIAVSILFQPAHQWISKRVKGPSASAALSLLAIVVLTLVPAIIMTTAIVGELKALYAALASKSTAGGGWEPWLTHILEKPLALFGMHVEDPEFSLKELAMNWVETASKTLLQIGRGALGNIAGFLLDSIITLFTLFFLLRDGSAIRRAATDILPLEQEQSDRLFSDVGRTVIANMYGILSVAIVQGSLTGLIFFLLGLHSPVLWGVAAGLCSMIPLLGPPIVWVPAAIYLAATGAYGKAAILAGFCAGIVGTADNFIRPYVISGQVNLHPLLVFFSLLGGANAFGVMGLFIGPAVLSVTISLIEVLRKPEPPMI